jgi:hypothetical protein
MPQPLLHRLFLRPIVIVSARFIGPFQQLAIYEAWQ